MTTYYIIITYKVITIYNIVYLRINERYLCLYNTGYYIIMYYVHLGEGRIEGEIQINYK